MINIKLIKELNDSLNPVDPVVEAMNSLDFSPTELDDDQLAMLADYMKEIIDDRRKKGSELSADEAAYMALDDVAGFETANPRVVQKTVGRLVAAYNHKFGKF